MLRSQHSIEFVGTSGSLQSLVELHITGTANINSSIIEPLLYILSLKLYTIDMKYSRLE